MCTSAPKVQQSIAPPVTETFDEGADREAVRKSDLRRRRRALSRSQTQAGGQMQGTAPDGKTLLGQ